MIEGQSRAPTRYPLEWETDSFFDKNALNQELERIFDICHGCRRCVSLCQSFPTLFDLIDNSETMEVDGINPIDYQKVVDHCYLCDLCYMTKCPYVPPHEWAVDFPHLMLRAKAVTFRNQKPSSIKRLIASPLTLGKFITTFKIAPIINYFNTRRLIRKAIEKLTKIDHRARLPRFYNKKASKQLSHHSYKQAPLGKIAIFTTCHGEYNDPTSVIDLAEVLDATGVEVKVIEPKKCCGMPQLEMGDLESVANYAKKNQVSLSCLVEAGYKLTAPIPSCVLMFKQELPLLLPQNETLQKIAKAFVDPFEYLSTLKKENNLNLEFKPFPKKVFYHQACHQRVQNIGNKTRDILKLIPDIDLDIAARCSGHDGTYGVLKETYTYAVKIGEPIAKQAEKSQAISIVSDCTMAGHHIAHIKGGEKIPVQHPISILKAALNKPSIKPSLKTPTKKISQNA